MQDIKMNELLTNDHVKLDIAQHLVTLRPITPEDKEIEASFVHNLSLETKYERFFEGIKDLSPYMLKKLCDIDYVSTMAYVATVQEDGKEKEIGVCRYAPGNNEDEREMALAIADDFPYLDVAVPLLEQLIAHAKSNNVKRLYSIEMSGNHRIIKLAKKMGMQAKTDPDDAQQMIYSLTL
jgi:acetyltransferase